MKTAALLLSVFNYLANGLSEDIDLNERKIKIIPVVDAVITNLKTEQWLADDEACLRATMDMLRGVQNRTLWATWMWDSIQLPSGSLYGAQAYFGNYDQCLQAPWSVGHPSIRSQYCLVEMKGPFEETVKTVGPFGDTEEYYKSLSDDDRQFNQHYFGVCLPSICAPSSVTKISRILLHQSHLPDGEVFLDPRDCEIAGQQSKYPAGYFVFWSVVGLFCVLSIISTLCNLLLKFETSSALGKFTNCFCLKRNGRSLFSINGDEIRSLHGIRVLAAWLLVFAHEGYFATMFPAINSLDINKMYNTAFGKMTLHLEIAVDAFFAMSGLLLIRNLMLGKQKNLIHTLAKRYVRLIGPLALCVLYYTTIGEFNMSGPMGKRMIRSETYCCSHYWWKTMLMVNTDFATLCHTVTWYISCDFQMTLLGTFLFILFRKNKKIGFITFGAIAISLTVYLGLHVYWYRLSMLPFDYRTIVENRKITNLNYVYFSPLARSGPYFVGMILGYVMSIYKPKDYRKLIDRKWSMIISKTAILVGFTVLCIGAIFSGRPYDAVEAAVVVATNRVVWAIAVCCIVAVCEYGSLILIPSILHRREFVPFSKLSYCLYLIHPIIIQMEKFSARSPYRYAPYDMTTHALGVLVLANVYSLVLYLILEAPLVNISNILFTNKSSEKKDP